MPVRSHMGHLSRDSYFSRAILRICAADRAFSSAELCVAPDLLFGLLRSTSRRAPEKYRWL
jgi:hypothetical protein